MRCSINQDARETSPQTEAEALNRELAGKAAAALATFSADDPMVILLQQHRVALMGRTSGPPPDDAASLPQRNNAMRSLIRDAESYRQRLDTGQGAQAQAAARAVCSEIERLFHNKAERYAALQSEDDSLLCTRVIVSADIARRVGVSPDGYRAIGPTAILVNWLRSLDKTIPYGREFSGVISAQDLMGRHGIGFRASVEMGVLFQTRYRAVNRALAEFAPAQIIELAAGLSPRGLHLTRDNPSLVYVETDLPDISAEKVLAVNTVVRREKLRGGFIRFEAVDASDRTAVVALLTRLRDDQTTAVVSEGLLLYLNSPELSAFCETMRQALTGSGRAWIADFVTQENLRQMFDDSPRAAEAVKSVFRSTNRNVVRDNPFTDDASVATFLAERGLRVQRTIRLADVVADGKFYSPMRSWHEAMFRLVGQRKIWVIRTK